MRIGALAKASGLSRDTIRFYERRGLISSQAESGQNSYRNYPEHALDTLRHVDGRGTVERGSVFGSGAAR